jgi:hypothetical protein
VAAAEGTASGAAAREAAAPEAAAPEAAAPEETPAAAAPSASERPAPRPRPLRDQTRGGGGPDVPVPSTSAAVAAGSSRIGGAVLIGVVLLALVGLVLWQFVFKSDDSKSGKTPNAAAKATATPAATPQQVGEIALKGVNGSKAAGVMRLYTAQGQLAFTLAGTGVPANKRNEAYAVWFTNPGGGSQRLGFAQPVSSNGQLGTTGPRTEDLDKFPRWLARYKQVVVSRESNGSARTPGPLILRGALPTGSK